jgi:renal tumor antigen
MDMNIYELIRGRRHYVAEERVQNYMYQLTRSMDHMHRNGIFHRDVKPENILIMDKVLKVADFGSCRGIYSKQPYTEYISTRWYRAPECLLTDGYYGYKMDMWGLGCVMFEVIALFPLFPGTNELDQIQKIHNVMGTPPAEVLDKFKRYSSGHIDFNFPQQEGTGIARMIPHASKECIDLIQKLLLYDPEERLSARQALRHPYFRNLREAEKRAQAAREAQQASASVGADASGGGGGGGGGSAGSGGVTNRAAKVARSHGHRTSRQDGLQMPVPPPGGSGALPPMAGGPPGAGASVGTGAPGAAYGGSVGAGGAGGQPTARFPQQHAVQEQIQVQALCSLIVHARRSLTTRCYCAPLSIRRTTRAPRCHPLDSSRSCIRSKSTRGSSSSSSSHSRGSISSKRIALIRATRALA